MARSKKRLEELLGRLESGEDVAARDLRNAIGDDEFQNFEDEWKNIQELKTGKWVETSSEYETLLHEGDFLYNKAESKRFKKFTHEFHAQAQAKYDAALTVLQSDMESNPNLRGSYDRLPDSMRSDVSLCPDGMPRAINSKSVHNQSAITRTTKRDLKISTVQRVLDDFDKAKDNKEIRLGRMQGRGGEEGKDGRRGMESKVEIAKIASDTQGTKLKRMLEAIRNRG